MVTGAIIACFIYIMEIRQFIFKTGKLLFYIAIGVQLVAMFAISCFEKARRKCPLNIILLMMYTVVQGGFLGFLSIFMTVDEVGVLDCTVLSL